MQDDRIWDLINRSMDSDLTPDESARLDAILSSDPSAKARYDHLASINRYLAGVPLEDPPRSLKPAIMASVHGRHDERIAEPGREQPHRISMLGRLPFYERLAASIADRFLLAAKDVVKGRKALVGVGLVGALAIVFFVTKGIPPTQHGAQGTIGTADRYRADQIRTDDVTTNETALDDALRNDEFQRIISSGEFQKLFADPGFRKLLADPGFGRLIADPGFGRLMTDPGFSKLVTSPGFGKLVTESDFGKRR